MRAHIRNDVFFIKNPDIFQSHRRGHGMAGIGIAMSEFRSCHNSGNFVADD